MIPFVGFITIPLTLWLVYKQAVNFKKIKDGIEAIKGGKYDEKIEINDLSGVTQNISIAPKITSEFVALADGINTIASGLGEEIERRMKSERLKTELIINVSHDMRTPLTSLVNYTDLIKRESTDNENIKKYVDIISNQAGRLKTLIEDLFESSKAASGNVNVNFENVNINSLLKQGLVELDEKIKTSSLDFKVNLPEEKVFAWADGRLLWRVIENLLSNTIKYSLENSRVYIDVSEDADKVFISIKNISADELNIPEDEVIERFKRGDESRNSEGSGLGLDIAKSLMICQNGELSIKIDGDLFKATVSIQKAEDA